MISEVHVMKPRTARRLSTVLLAVGCLIPLFSNFSKIWGFVGMMIAGSAVLLIFLFYRCPYCGKVLKNTDGDFCPYCGRDITACESEDAN